MATQVQWRRGTHAQVAAFTGAIGEVVADLTQKRLVLQDGVTAGGSPHATLGDFAAMPVALNEGYVPSVASAATIDLGAQVGNYVQITGTTLITSFGSSLGTVGGAEREIVFTGVLTLTQSGNLILLNGANITTAAGDVARFRYEGSGVWRLMDYSFYSGQPFVSPAAQIGAPQGRLTLTSNTPVMTANTAGATTVYYAPYAGNAIPIYNGTTTQVSTFSQLSLALDSNAAHTGYQQSGKLFDLFVFLNSGVVTLGTGPAWTSTTARGTGAGTTQVSLTNGIWTNTVSIALKIDTTAATISVPAGQATYVGTMYATANGQTSMTMAPAAANGGAGSILGVYNAYNRVPTSGVNQDNRSNWSYASAAWRAADNSALNSVTFVDGLAQSYISALYSCQGLLSGSAANQFLAIGVGLNSTTTPFGSSTTSLTVPAGGAAATTQLSCPLASTPLLGLTVVNAIEYGNATATFSLFGMPQAVAPCTQISATVNI